MYSKAAVIRFLKSAWIIPIILIIIQLLQATNSQCSVCGTTSSVACINSTSFYMCPSGSVPDVTQVLTCATGTSCVDTAAICAAATTGVAAACDCGACDAALRFACINSTSYSLCLGTSTPSTSLIGHCATGTYCNILSTIGFCGTAPTCSIATVPTFPTNATGWCNFYGDFVGNFPVLTDGTCKTYVKCTPLSTGRLVYTCVGQTVFNPTTLLCVAPESFDCALALSNFRL